MLRRRFGAKGRISPSCTNSATSMATFEARAMATLKERLLAPHSDAAAQMHLRTELSTVEQRLKALIWKTVLDSVNASVILYGYPGVGKTLVVERALAALERDLSGEIPILCVIRLSGIIEGDKSDAFKAIARQLCAFMDIPFASHISTDRNIKFLKAALPKLHQANRSCVFVLDAFERFVRDGDKQEVIYTLLDVLQSKTVRACVIGLTTDFCIKSDFDKRVHSRFSHKSWIVPTCDDLVGLLTAMMELPMGHKDKKKIEKFNKSIDAALADPDLKERLKLESCTLSPRDARDISLLTFSAAILRGEKTFKITPADVTYALQQCIDRSDPFPVKIAQLPLPHLYVLIACAQLQTGFSYKDAFVKYECFIRTQSTSDVFEAPLMTHAFEELYHENFFIRVKETRTPVVLLSPYDFCTINVTRDEIHRGIAQNPFASTALMAFLRSE